jgi:3-oxoacyl-[acyl-carrier protein] reductase
MAFLNDLEGKRVLVTGSSTGIGAAAAKAFSQCGARVGVHYGSNRGDAEQVVADIRDGGGSAELFCADVRKSAEVDRLVKDAIAGLGGLDILVNNAGGLVRRAETPDFTDELFDEILALNARSVVMACRAAIPHFRNQGHGNIINTGSIAARNAGGIGAGVYASSKAFIHNMTRALAKELVADHIRVNCVAPGVIFSPFHKDTPKEAIEGWEKAIPMGRLGTGEDCAGAFLFLASDSMSAYVTGQIIDVNGGFFMP